MKSAPGHSVSGTRGDAFLSTLHYAAAPEWARRSRSLGPEDTRRLPLPTELANAARTFLALCGQTPLVLNSSAGRLRGELIAAALAGLIPRRRRPTAVLVGEMWQKDPGLRGRLEATIVRLADRAIDRYVVYSSRECTHFPALWGVAPAKVRFVPFFSTVEHLATPPQASSGSYVFSGGNPFRDYAPLLEAARVLSDVDFVLATSALEGQSLPKNVRAGPVSHTEFMALLAGAAVVVVPIRAGLDRAVGQQTYLNAMRLGKATIVSEGLAVRDHIQDGVTGLVVTGTTESYVTAFRWLLDPANADSARRLGAAAAADVQERFTFDRHVQGLLAVLDEAITTRSGSGATDAFGG